MLLQPLGKHSRTACAPPLGGLETLPFLPPPSSSFGGGAGGSARIGPAFAGQARGYSLAEPLPPPTAWVDSEDDEYDEYDRNLIAAARASARRGEHGGRAGAGGGGASHDAGRARAVQGGSRPWTMARTAPCVAMAMVVAVVAVVVRGGEAVRVWHQDDRDGEEEEEEEGEEEDEEAHEEEEEEDEEEQEEEGEDDEGEGEEDPREWSRHTASWAAELSDSAEEDDHGSLEDVASAGSDEDEKANAREGAQAGRLREVRQQRWGMVAAVSARAAASRPLEG